MCGCAGVRVSGERAGDGGRRGEDRGVMECAERREETGERESESRESQRES